MQSLFKRTRTSVLSPAAQRRERETGLYGALCAMTAVQMAAQLLLWLFFEGYDRSEQTVWQAAMMLLLPLAAVFLIWKHADVSHSSARWWILPLFLCLLADAVFLTAALSGFIAQVVPFYPPWITVLIPSAVCFFTALVSHIRGSAYGSLILAVPMVILLVFSTVFLRGSTRADRLWPILGNGLLYTVQTAFSGAGAVWGAALLFALPRKQPADSGISSRRFFIRNPAFLSAFLPWALFLLCSIWFGFLKPWSAGDDLPVAEKMMGLGRNAHSIILYEMAGILWMILLPAALTACFSSAGRLLANAFPALSEWFSLLPAAVLSALASVFLSHNLFGLLSALLPSRFVISLLCGSGLLITQRRST